LVEQAGGRIETNEAFFRIMLKKTPAWQCLLQRFLVLRPVTWLMARLLHHADAFLLRLTGGRLDFTRLSGLPVIELTTTGAKSGKLRTLPLAGLPEGNKLVLIASNFGRARHPAWYHNLKANPECAVRKNGKTGTYIARETEGAERDRCWQMAVSYYLGYEAYRQRAGNRRIPVIVLELKQ
jgi:deazaflavin-dependent oxidoreductase (nitroreductase family)